MTANCTYYGESLLKPSPNDDAHTTDSDAISDAEVDSTVDSTNGDGPDASADANHDIDVELSDVLQDTATDAPESDGAACDLLRPPLHPGGVDDGGDIEFTVAVSGIDFGDRIGSDPNERGFDIDGCCTCGPSDPCHGGSTCLRPDTTDAQHKPNHCDGPNGQDNATGKLMQPIVAITGAQSNFGSDSWTLDVKEGRWSVLMHVSGYNGKANDAAVELRWYVPGGFNEDKEPDAMPKWDGKDKWPISASCLEKLEGDPPYDINRTKYKVSRAYVVNHTLVAGFSVVEFNVGINYGIKIYAMTLVAKLEQTKPNEWTFKTAELTAVWKATDVLAQMPRLNLGGVPLCRNHPVYNLVKENVCSYTDSPSGAASPSVPCDGLSMGAHLTTLPALRGTIIPAKEEGKNPCPNDGPEPDTCGSD